MVWRLQRAVRAVSMAEMPWQEAESKFEEFLQGVFDLLAIPAHDPDTLSIVYDLTPNPVSGALDLSTVPLRSANGGPNFW
jgi:hypothetical protein